MNKELIVSLKEHMSIKAGEVGLTVHLEDEGDFIQIQLLDDNNRIIYTTYEAGNIIAFIYGIQSDYKYHHIR